MRSLVTTSTMSSRPAGAAAVIWPRVGKQRVLTGRDRHVLHPHLHAARRAHHVDVGEAFDIGGELEVDGCADANHRRAWFERHARAHFLVAGRAGPGRRSRVPAAPRP